MSKARGQSRKRALRRGNIDFMGNSLKRPFNNSKRNRGRQDQIKAEKYYRYMKAKLEEIQKSLTEENESKDL